MLPSKENSNVWVVSVIEDPDHPGELLLDLGEEICNQLGWDVGDQLEWVCEDETHWVLKKNG